MENIYILACDFYDIHTVLSENKRVRAQRNLRRH